MSRWLAGADGIDFPYAAQAAFIRREIFEITGGRISKECALILTSRKDDRRRSEPARPQPRGN
ncbi:MAG TPA: hypothetical protein VMV92_34255 [Streptosporangiaceae bacterium]|nr:hypothetical protein [Streptosporangiaceae bacterium]